MLVKQRDYEVSPTEESFIETYKYMKGDVWKRVDIYRTATEEYLE